MRRHPELSYLCLITTNRFQRGQFQLGQPPLDVIISMTPDIGQLVRCSMDEQPLGLETGFLQNW